MRAIRRAIRYGWHWLAATVVAWIGLIVFIGFVLPQTGLHEDFQFILAFWAGMPVGGLTTMTILVIMGDW